MFSLFQIRSSLSVWQKKYCENDFASCERYKRSAEGKHSPMNLLPNGETLTVSSGAVPAAKEPKK